MDSGFQQMCAEIKNWWNHALPTITKQTQIQNTNHQKLSRMNVNDNI